MLQWGIAPGSKNLALRPGLGSAAGMWPVAAGGVRRGLPESGRR